MATDARIVNAGDATDAGFRVFASGISAGLAAVGLVKTGDAGQINFATAVRPTVANTSAGYEIWRFADALQATAPVFVKVEYGNFGNYTTSNSIRLSIGTGSDGNGNLTGVLVTGCRVAVYPGAGNVNVNSNLLTSGALNRVIQGWFGVTNTNPFWSLERTHAEDGTDTAEGLLFVWRTQAIQTVNQGPQTIAQHFVFGAAAQPPQQLVEANAPGSGLIIPWPFGGAQGAATAAAPATLSNQGDVGILPVFFYRGRLSNPSLNLWSYWSPDIVNDSIVNFTAYGAQRTGRAIGSCTGIDNAMATAPNANRCLLMRWE